MVVQVIVNGEKKDVTDQATVAGLICELGLGRYTGIAVELNGRFVDRQTYETTVVPPGAILEIVRFVGGG
ncbi:MAG: sulfur carrier protein ThiS [Kiritimatiellae bacterium]|nr:sulfur carrier protein ThiS [Kiritimatiellia bacterium]